MVPPRRTGKVAMSHILVKAIAGYADCDVYRVTHRSGRFIDVAAVSINDARHYAAAHYKWKQLDMHARVIEVAHAGPERRSNRLRAWLTGALPFNLWR
jgi:hypothetical protein